MRGMEWSGDWERDGEGSLERIRTCEERYRENKVTKDKESGMVTGESLKKR